MPCSLKDNLSRVGIDLIMHILTQSADGSENQHNFSLMFIPCHGKLKMYEGYSTVEISSNDVKAILHRNQYIILNMKNAPHRRAASVKFKDELEMQWNQ